MEIIRDMTNSVFYNHGEETILITVGKTQYFVQPQKGIDVSILNLKSEEPYRHDYDQYGTCEKCAKSYSTKETSCIK